MGVQHIVRRTAVKRHSMGNGCTTHRKENSTKGPMGVQHIVRRTAVKRTRSEDTQERMAAQRNYHVL